MSPSKFNKVDFPEPLLPTTKTKPDSPSSNEISTIPRDGLPFLPIYVFLRFFTLIIFNSREY